MSIEWPCYLDQTLGEVAIDTPVASLVGIGQRSPFDWSTEAGVIELVMLGGETHFDVAQAFAISKLRESHGQKLIPTREGTNTLVAPIASHAAIEFLVGKKADELCEDGATLIQVDSPSKLIFEG